MPEAGHVKIVIYDNNGKHVTTLVNTNQSYGAYSVQWNAQNQPSGIYFAVISLENQVWKQKLLLLK